jgi:hypothetical protein
MRTDQPPGLYPGTVMAPSSKDFDSSTTSAMEMSVAVPSPSQCGHMPPLTEKDLRSTCLPSPLSMVTAPFPLRVATLKEYAFVDPRFGSARRAKRVRSFALMSETVPTVERGFAPIRSWSTRMAVVSPSSTSTSGRAIAGMNPWTKAEYVSLIILWDSAAMVWKTSELLPEPETPVKTVRRRLGMSTDTFFRLFSRAPLTRMRSWLSAVCTGLSSSAGCGSCSQPGRAGRSRADHRAGPSALARSQRPRLPPRRRPRRHQRWPRRCRRSCPWP